MNFDFPSLPLGWRSDIVKDGDIPSREEHVFVNDFDEDSSPESGFGGFKTRGKIRMKEAFVAGYGIPYERNTCRTWDGRSPLQKCKFPFKIKVSSSLNHPPN